MRKRDFFEIVYHKKIRRALDRWEVLDSAFSSSTMFIHSSTSVDCLLRAGPCVNHGGIRDEEDFFFCLSRTSIKELDKPLIIVQSDKHYEIYMYKMV